MRDGAGRGGTEWDGTTADTDWVFASRLAEKPAAQSSPVRVAINEWAGSIEGIHAGSPRQRSTPRLALPRAPHAFHKIRLSTGERGAEGGGGEESGGLGVGWGGLG